MRRKFHQILNLNQHQETVPAEYTIQQNSISRGTMAENTTGSTGYSHHLRDRLNATDTHTGKISRARSPPPIPPRKRTSDLGQPQQFVDVNTANIVVFGETGVGKSSIINLIAGQQLARASNDAHGCTFQHDRYTIVLDKSPCVLWDTTGLDEGSEGTVPAELAEKSLKELMWGLAHSGGIHLVIYCIRGSRLTKALRRNYDLFYVTVCRKKVPVALVVTGLEYQEGGMEGWWTENKAALQRNGMRFDVHACVTTIDVEDDIIQQRRWESQQRLQELVLKYTGLPGWKANPSFMSRVLPVFYAAFHGMSFMRGTSRKVIVCGSFSEYFPGTTAVLEHSPVRIGDKRYEFLRVDKHALHTISPKTLEDVGGEGTGALIFYTSALDHNRIPPTDIKALKRFYDVAGGQSCPVIVVLQGCYDETVAWECHIDVTSHYRDIQAHFVPIPRTGEARARLDEMIDNLCMEQVEAPKLFKKK